VKLDWQREAGSRPCWSYQGDDVCACVWVDAGTVWWDVSGPRGRWTIVSGCVTAADVGHEPYDDVQPRVENRMRVARRYAELWIAGYRRGRMGAEVEHAAQGGEDPA